MYSSDLSAAEVLTAEARRTGTSDAAFKSVCYQAHVANYGWQDWVCNGWAAGTEGKNSAIEKVRITMSGNGRFCAQAHVRNYGWLDRDCEAQGGFVEVGTTGLATPMEALGVWTENGGMLRAQGHVQNIGWMTPTVWGYGHTIGTTGRGLSLEAIRLWV
ncbi:hypothetical protein [Streptomyces lavendulocolor]|uniref:hypothetical protein n=1 Tax=Streptomyces lavendulocolor TaxID=67316 RepID=UPI003C2B939A